MKLTLLYPSQKYQHLTQGFKSGHQAVDFAFNRCYGTFLVAPRICEVEKIVTDETLDNEFYPAFQRGYGIVLRDFLMPQYRYLYWHCLQVFPVMVGQKVYNGDIVAQIGNSGLCYSNGVEVPLKNRGTKGSHLHFEMFDGDTRISPLPFIDWLSEPKLNKLKAIEQIVIRMKNFIKDRK
jgi:murein DD-endopeptidase MepM/ murein hydrolase activator NlpD